MFATAQRIEPFASFRDPGRDSYFRFHYDNDYFTKTDRYYTQGITLEYAHPFLRKNPLDKILVRPGDARLNHAVLFHLFGFTPTSIESNEILFGDRPFAATASFQFAVAGTDTVRQRRISSFLLIGVIGPLAQGEEIQTGIHRWLKNKLPIGWQYQVANDLLLNYQVNYEKKMLQSRWWLVNSMAEVRVGTLNTSLSGGVNFMIGRFNDPYSPKLSSKKIQCYLYGQARVNIIGYDASLQGGLLNERSAYTIADSDISRLVFQADYGIAFYLRNIFLTYSQAYLTREFATGVHHRWGGVSLGLSF